MHPSGFLIPAAELVFRFSRSGGVGGQHVNTSSTRVEVLWNVAKSRAVTDEQRARIQERLEGRMDAEGNLRVVSSGRRSQLQNRRDAVRRLERLVAGALRERKARKPTRTPTAAREARLAEKRRRAERKQGRRRVERDRGE